MKQHRKRGVRDACAHTADDDGTNPKFDRDEDERRPSRWKDRQVERLARRAIESALLSHPQAIDWGVRVAAIEVAARGSLLQVGVVWDAPVRAEQVGPWLTAQQGAARLSVARVFNRKRAPAIALIAVGRSEPDEPGDDHEQV